MTTLAPTRDPLAPLGDDEYRRQADPKMATNPLFLIPPEWRKPVSVLWTTNAHLLPTALALCARLRLYAESGLTEEDVQRICRRLTQPEKAATHRFAADLLADLSGEVANVIRSKKAAEQTRAMRIEAEAFRAVGLAGPDDLFPDANFGRID